MKCRVLVSISALAVAAVALSACASDAKFVAPQKSAASVSLSPTADDDNVPVSAELGTTVTDGKVTDVVVTTADGDPVAGHLRDDGTSWVPDEPLAYRTGYKATVTAVDAKEIPTTGETTFTTMKKPKNYQTATLLNESKAEYGQAMPIVVNFDDQYEVPEKYRAEVERRLFVESEPDQPGVWHWFSGNHLEYRPKEFWEPGTNITVRAALEGVNLGHHKYGKADISRSFGIDKTVREIKISDKNKKMVAMKNGEKVRSMPISLGRADKPSYSGTMIVMEKFDNIMFDTTAECGGKETGDCYRTPVDYAERLTWSGQFIHSAPWSVGDQGYRNVSHGCVNAAPDDAKWVYEWSQVGDPVIITDTGTHLPAGDGYTAYDLSWEDFQAGSYLSAPGSNADDHN